jgi:outer membrane protein assembly factor BamB
MDKNLKKSGSPPKTIENQYECTKSNISLFKEDSRMNIARRTKSHFWVACLTYFSVLLSLCFSTHAVQTLTAQEATTPNIFLPAPRILKQHLSRARRAIEEKQYSDAVSHLGTILTEEIERDDANAPEAGDNQQAEANQDYFVETPEAPGSYVSLKGEAQRLLGSLPPVALQLYELQYGSDATRMLDESLATGDFSNLTIITRKYFHTSAGYEAAILLGHRDRDHGRPLAAALNFKRVYDSPAARSKYDPELSLILATCWLDAQIPRKAVETLRTLKQNIPNSRFDVGGKQYDIFAANDDPLQWLNTLAGQGEIISLSDNIQWVLFRGSPSRNANSQGGNPMPSLRWTIPTGRDRSDEIHLQSMVQGEVLQNQHAISTVQPLVVQNTVLTRTPRQLIAVDFTTGKRLWEFPWFETDTQESLLKASTQNPEGASTTRQLELRQRLMQDNAYGQVSSDSERVFLLWDLPVIKQTSRTSFMVNPATGKKSGAESSNQLAALDLKTEGSLAWIVGGTSGEDEPALAGAFFLGPPLPLYGELYAIAELNGEIRLCVLDAANGSLKWQQQLAHVDSRVISIDKSRRLAGATPSFADGVLVCPTSAGAIVAVDISARTLLWGYTYENLKMVRGYPFNRTISSNLTKRSQQWIDATLTIADGSVIATPVESDKLICLDLLTGKPQWKPLTRTKDLYIACIKQETIVIVGEQKISAINMATGEDTWEKPIDISPGIVNGRGFLTNQTYFVPTHAKELLEIDIKTGKIVDKTKLQKTLGNLICYEDQIISQTPDSLTVYYQLAPLKKEVTARLAADKDDVWALSRKCELLVQEELYDDALIVLRSTAKLAPNDLGIEQLMIRTMISLLRADYASYKSLGPELQQLTLTMGQFEEYLQTKAEGQRITGQITESFETYLELIEHSSKQTDISAHVTATLRLSSDGVHVRIDRLVQGQLHTLLSSATEQQRQQIESRISEFLKAAVATANVNQLRDFSRYFGTHPLAQQARLELAIALIETQAGYAREMLEAEMLLIHLQRHTADEVLQRTTMVYLAKLLSLNNQYDLAAQHFQAIAKRWPNEPVFEDMTGIELRNTELQRDEFKTFRDSDRQWPQGFTTVSKTTDTKGQFPSYQRIYNIQLLEVTGPWNQGTQVGYDQQKNALTLRDPNGNITQQVSLHRGRQIFGTQYQVAYAKIMGHYMFTFVGREMLAIDLLSAKSDPSEAILWRRSILGPNANPASPIPVRSRVSTTPWGTRRYNAIDSSGRRLGMSGSISLLGIVFQNQEDLYCVDPLTGDTIWVRNGVPIGSEIYTEGDKVVVIPPRSNNPQHKPLSLSLIDGTIIAADDGAGPIENDTVNTAVASSERWKVHGFKALGYVIKGSDITLRLEDVSTGKSLWQISYPTGIRGQLLNNKLAVMQQNGKFEIRDLLSGEIVIQKTLKAEPQISNLYVIEYQNRFLVIPNRSQSSRGISLPSVGLQTKLINGNIYCLDKQTGEFLWQTPASVESWGLPLAQSPNSPVLAFIRQLNPTSTQNRTQGSIRSEVFCIDKRDGRLLMPPREIPGYIRIFNVIAAPDENKVTVIADKNHIYKFELSADPTYPAAPVRMLANSTPASDSSFNQFTRGFFDAFGNTSRAIQINKAEKKAAQEIKPIKQLPQKKVPDKQLPQKGIQIIPIPVRPGAPKPVPKPVPKP